jgi:hypothetical protein
VTADQMELIAAAMEDGATSTVLPGHGTFYLDDHRTNTYPPNATNCAEGHVFHSEADCFMPEGWDNFMCRRCLDVTA